MGTNVAAGAIVALAASPVSVADTQQRFIQALALVEQGRPAEAAEVLLALYSEAPTPRLRLELARALMLSGRHKEAKRLFIAAYNDNPPPVVKANILAFLDQMDRQSGRLTLNLSVSHYGNPLQQPGSYTLNFGGIDLTYEPDQTYRNLWGATVGTQYRKEFSGGLIFSGAASYRSLPHNGADRFTAEFNITKKLGSGPFELQLGTVHLGQLNQTFTLPYAQVGYTHSLGRHTAIQPSVKIGYYAAKAGEGLTGWQGDAFTPIVYAPTPAKMFAIGPMALRHDVGFPEQSYTSVGLRAIATIRTDKFSLEGGLQARLTRFDAIDPFWGLRRKDEGAFATLMISTDRVRLGPFLPAAGISCDLNRSTIKYFQQSNCDMLFEVRKAF